MALDKVDEEMRLRNGSEVIWSVSTGKGAVKFGQVGGAAKEL